MASGLFAEYGLNVELVEPAPGPENVERVASGAVDFCLTSVSHFLHAQHHRPLPARFVGVVVQRSPIAGLVAADSDLWSPGDLSGGRVGAPADGGLLAEYRAALEHRGLPVSMLVPTSYEEAPAALGRGEIDIVPDFVDLLPRTRRQSGVPVRAVAVGPEAYASGLVAGDSLPFDVVAQMRTAILAALQRQRSDPDWGVSALCDRYPGVDPSDALEGWLLVEPNIFTDPGLGSMEPDRWRFTLEHLSGAHGLTPSPAKSVYRSEFLSAWGEGPPDQDAVRRAGSRPSAAGKGVGSEERRDQEALPHRGAS